MKDFWNTRYSAPEFVYGEEPNTFFKEQLVQYEPGRILLPAEGEGRNAVFAARLNWEVSAFDWSEAGKVKAEQLASCYEVELDYQVKAFSEIEYPDDFFDAIGLIYAHFPANVKSSYHRQLDAYLRPGGVLIFEAFSKSHLQFNTVDPKAGGPKDVSMLFSVEEIQQDFAGYKVVALVEEELELQEGDFHQGKSSVIRFVGIKP